MLTTDKETAVSHAEDADAVMIVVLNKDGGFMVWHSDKCENDLEYCAALLHECANEVLV